MPVIPPGFGQLEIHYNIEGQHDGMNTFGVALIGVITPGDLDTIVNPVLDAYRDVLSGGSSSTSARLVQNFSGDLMETNSVSGAGLGRRTNPTVSPQVQVLAVKNTNLVGRKHRGRSFFPDAQEGNVDNVGQLNGGEIAVYAALVNELDLALNDGTFTDGHVILHNDATAPTPVTSFTVSGKVATLRNRLNR